MYDWKYHCLRYPSGDLSFLCLRWAICTLFDVVGGRQPHVEYSSSNAHTYTYFSMLPRVFLWRAIINIPHPRLLLLMDIYLHRLRMYSQISIHCEFAIHVLRSEMMLGDTWEIVDFFKGYNPQFWTSHHPLVYNSAPNPQWSSGYDFRVSISEILYHSTYR